MPPVGQLKYIGGGDTIILLKICVRSRLIGADKLGVPAERTFRTRVSLTYLLGTSPSKIDVICCPEAVIPRNNIVSRAPAETPRMPAIRMKANVKRTNRLKLLKQVTWSPPAGSWTKREWVTEGLAHKPGFRHHFREARTTYLPPGQSRPEPTLLFQRS